MSVRFVKDAVTIDLQNPEVGNKRKIQKYQGSRRAAGGQLYVYDKGITVYHMTMAWANLRDTEKIDLDTFFDVSADGMVNTFTFTDWRGVAWTARFLHTDIEFTEIADTQSGAATTFKSPQAGTDYPTTTRIAPAYWTCQVEMEVVEP